MFLPNSRPQLSTPTGFSKVRGVASATNTRGSRSRWRRTTRTTFVSRWGKTVDELHVMQDRAVEYESRMKAALRSRESVLREFDKLGQFHHTFPKAKGCSCGKVDCET